MGVKVAETNIIERYFILKVQKCEQSQEKMPFEPFEGSKMCPIFVVSIPNFFFRMGYGGLG